VLAVNWPGQFSFDSVVQLAEGRTGAYSGEHPPVMSWLLGVADWLTPGASSFVVLDAALVFGALAAFVMAARGGGWLALPLAAAMVFFPQLAVYPAIVWKDVLFAGAACAGFAALAWAAESWDRRRRRWLLIAAAAALLTLASLARQNGAVVLPFAAGALAWIAARRGVGVGRAAGYGTGFLAASATVGLAAAAALATHIDAPRPLGAQWEHLQIYDLTGALVRDPALPLPVLRARAPWLETLVRGAGADAYSPSRLDPLMDAVFDPMAAHPDVSGAVADQWRQLIWRHPWLYLRTRAAAFGWVALTPKLSECVAVETGVDGPADGLAAAGLAERRTPRDDALEAYALAFAPTPAYSHAAYAAAALALLGFFLARRRPADIAAAAMLASALAFAASFALISLACDYRYLYALDLAAIAAALYAAASIPAPRLARRRPGA
jgi:hypothetical protein